MKNLPIMRFHLFTRRLSRIAFANLVNKSPVLAGLAGCHGQYSIYGECGGYVVLGTGITDASGNRFDMAGLLDVETSLPIKSGILAIVNSRQ